MRTAERESRPPSLAQAWHALSDDVVGMVSDRVHLLALELSRARVVMVEIVAMLLAAALLVGVAWLLIGVIAIVALVEAGWPWLGALGVVLAVNLALGVAALLRARSLVPRLALPGTMRCLTAAPLGADAGSPTPEPEAIPISLSAAAVPSPQEAPA